MISRIWVIPGFTLLLFVSACWGQTEVPALTQRVTDLTATLSPTQTNSLEQKLAAFEAAKGSQIAVLIVPTTQPETLEEYAIRVADAWKIGRKNVDDGVILIVAKNDRRMRLEVGYGLEGAIPDAIAKRVIAETITPLFKQGDFAGGIEAGVSQLMQLIQGESLPEPSPTIETQHNDGLFMFILVAGIFTGAILSSVFGRVSGALISSLGSATVAGLLLGVGFGVIIGLIVFFFLAGNFNHRGGGGGWSSRGGYYSGGSWGGGGGGSWSGGGGSFGGGGASGSW